MTQAYFITGTDTDVGKTVAAAWLMLHLDGAYWKPVQSGTDGGTDEESVRGITGFAADRFFAPTYTLSQPLSPHEAARRDGVTIAMEKFTPPPANRPLVIEGAGGLMVPLNRDNFVIDLIAHLNVPAILVCRSMLGTINHTLLSLKALNDRGIPVAGLVMNGPRTPHNRAALEEYGGVPVLAEIAPLPAVTRDALLAIRPAFALPGQKAAA